MGTNINTRGNRSYTHQGKKKNARRKKTWNSVIFKRVSNTKRTWFTSVYRIWKYLERRTDEVLLLLFVPRVLCTSRAECEVKVLAYKGGLRRRRVHYEAPAFGNIFLKIASRTLYCEIREPPIKIARGNTFYYNTKYTFICAMWTPA